MEGSTQFHQRVGRQVESSALRGEVGALRRSLTAITDYNLDRETCNEIRRHCKRVIAAIEDRFPPHQSSRR